MDVSQDLGACTEQGGYTHTYLDTPKMHLGRGDCIQGGTTLSAKRSKVFTTKTSTRQTDRRTQSLRTVTGLALRKQFLESDKDTWHDEKYKLEHWMLAHATVTERHFVNEVFGDCGAGWVGFGWGGQC